jgi:hypothetical protein
MPRLHSTLRPRTARCPRAALQRPYRSSTVSACLASARTQRSVPSRRSASAAASLGTNHYARLLPVHADTTSHHRHDFTSSGSADLPADTTTAHDLPARTPATRPRDLTPRALSRHASHRCKLATRLHARHGRRDASLLSAAAAPLAHTSPRRTCSPQPSHQARVDLDVIHELNPSLFLPSRSPQPVKPETSSLAISPRDDLPAPRPRARAPDSIQHPDRIRDPSHQHTKPHCVQRESSSPRVRRAPHHHDHRATTHQPLLSGRISLPAKPPREHRTPPSSNRRHKSYCPAHPAA